MTTFTRRSACLIMMTLSFGLMTAPAFAAPAKADAAKTGSLKAGLDTAVPAELKGSDDLKGIFAGLISGVLELVGVILFAYLLYGGFKYMTAAGESKKIEEAIGIIRSAIIGIVLIGASYALTTFVLTSLENATSKGPTGKAVPCPAGQNC